MHENDLQKTAKNDPTPKEVLNPREAAEHYTFKIHPPSNVLAPFIDYYWIMRWDLTNQPPFMAEVIPSPYTNLTFMPEGARITGVTTGKYEYQLKDRGAIIGAKFKPGALYAFYGKGVHDLTNTHIPALSVFSAATDEYNNEIVQSSNEQAVKKIEELLKSKDPKVDKNLKLITEILGFIELQNPTLTDVVVKSALSERRLQEIFKQYVGVGVKWIILRARLIKAVELATTNKNPNWARVAQSLGYSDQSHFINDFKRVIGKSPTKYAAEIIKR